MIIYRATGVINFAQGGLVALGAYLDVRVRQRRRAAVRARGRCSRSRAPRLVGAAIERVVLRRMVGQPVFAVIMITIGLLFIIEQVVTAIWGFDALNLGDPWGVAHGRRRRRRDVACATCGRSASRPRSLAGFFAFFRFSKLGVAMRATAFDPEAALAQGISARSVYAVSWAISAGLAALAGVTLAAGAGGADADDRRRRAGRVPGDDRRRARLAGRRGARRAASSASRRR